MRLLARSIAREQEKTPISGAFVRADEGARTLDLLHGNHTRPFAPADFRSLDPHGERSPRDRLNTTEHERTASVAIVATGVLLGEGIMGEPLEVTILGFVGGPSHLSVCF